jgi:hypothetical protein
MWSQARYHCLGYFGDGCSRYKLGANSGSQVVSVCSFFGQQVDVDAECTQNPFREAGHALRLGVDAKNKADEEVPFQKA